MNFKNIFLPMALMLLCVVGIKAQSPGYVSVSFDGIEKQVKENPERYKALTARFAEADTSLTPEEVALVYYGYAFTPDYNPTATYPDIVDALKGEDGTLAITLIDEALRKNPVSLPLLFNLYGCCATSDVPRLKERAPGVLDRIFMLCDMIVSTGTGVQPVMPWIVINEADVDEILNKYLVNEVQRVLDKSDKGEARAVKVRLDGVDDDVVLYFDLALPRRHAERQIGK